jgi:hypothetical protein
MENRKYKSFWEFLVRTPINLTTTIIWSLLAVVMIITAIGIKEELSPEIFILWVAFFSGIPIGMILRVWLIYKRVNN